MTLDAKGRLVLAEIPHAESNLKLCKVVGKSVVKGNKAQIHLHDGKNILTSEKVEVGESVLINLPSLEIKEVLHLKPGVKIFLTKGKHIADIGNFVEIKEDEVIYEVDGQEIKTAKDYVFVVGKDKPLITLKK
jgi:small subunit ribosomal protein S4e